MSLYSGETAMSVMPLSNVAMISAPASTPALPHDANQRREQSEAFAFRPH